MLGELITQDCKVREKERKVRKKVREMREEEK